MPQNDITSELASLLGQDVQDAESTGDPTAAHAAGFREVRPGIQMLNPVVNPTSFVQTGRGPTGRLRNFRAMNDGKLLFTAREVHAEANDTEAMGAILLQLEQRNLTL